MNKMLLKRLLFEYLEDFAYLERHLQVLALKVHANVLPYIQFLQSQLIEARTKLLSHQSLFLKGFTEEVLDDADLKRLFHEVFYDAKAEIGTFVSALYRLQRPEASPETDLFIRSLEFDKLLPDAPALIVLPSETLDAAEATQAAERYVLESLPLLSVDAPLRWFGIFNQFTRVFCERTLKLQSVLEKLALPTRYDILIPLVNLRLLGPAYYAAYILNAFKNLTPEALWVIEPLLFQELNRFGLIHKDLVILHQSVERARLEQLTAEPRDLTLALGTDEAKDALLKVIEKIVPDRLAYTEKNLLRSQLLEDRLSNHVMISAVPMLSTVSQLRDDLDDLKEDETIYPLLTQLQESPASPREIINAGWLHKLEDSMTQLQALLESPNNDTWNAFQASVMLFDELLLKSIEISEVHRVLSFAEYEPQAVLV